MTRQQAMARLNITMAPYVSRFPQGYYVGFSGTLYPTLADAFIGYNVKRKAYEQEVNSGKQ